MKTVLLAALLLTAPIKAQEYRELPAELPTSRYGVIGVRLEAIGPDSVAIAKVRLHSPAHRAGLRQGDRIVAIPPYRIRTQTELSRYIQSYAPGDTLTLVLRRNDQRLHITCGVTDVKNLYYLMDEETAQTPANRVQFPRARARPAAETAARALIDRHDATAAFDSLRRALVADADRYGRDGRLQAVDQVLRNPLQTGRIAHGLIDDFNTGTTLADHLKTAARHLDLTLPPLAPTANDHPVLPSILGPIAAAFRSTDRAFADLTTTERTELVSGIPALLARFGDTGLLDEGDSTETTGHIRTLRQAKRVDLSALFTGALHLARLADPDTLKTLRRALQNLSPVSNDSLPPGLTGNFLFAAQTAQGWLLIGDKGPNFYGSDATAIIDLGGDDIYLHSHPTPTALIIDYDGDDRYLGGGIATGIGNIGLLVDLAGNDLYQGGDRALGTAFCGIGMLWDRRGDDHYFSAQVGQGAAFFGAGLLVDSEGDDLYSAALYAQGFGGMRGLGLLYDRDGDDRYLIDGHIPSSYGTPDTYAGWGQGVGCGFRGYGSGGIGLLIDGDGADYYQGGDFAQGVGYFFGLGVLGDLRGDDHYRGSRYAQGAAAHQAAGALIERAGNDRYETKIAAAQGAGWDAAIGYLADLMGDDPYEAQHLSQGAAAMNGLGLLYDGDGVDYYQTLTGQGQGSSTTYWGGRDAPNMGLLIDDGGDTDIYSLRKNQADARDAGIGLFADR